MCSQWFLMFDAPVAILPLTKKRHAHPPFCLNGSRGAGRTCSVGHCEPNCIELASAKRMRFGLVGAVVTPLCCQSANRSPVDLIRSRTLSLIHLWTQLSESINLLPPARRRRRERRRERCIYDLSEDLARMGFQCFRARD